MIRDIAMVLLCLSVCACHGMLRVKGRVLDGDGQKGAGESRIQISLEPIAYIDEHEPIQNAKVSIYYGADYRTDSLDEETIWKRVSWTDENGCFELEDMTSPYSVLHTLLRIEHPRYRTIDIILKHESPQEHHVEALLKRK